MSLPYLACEQCGCDTDRIVEGKPLCVFCEDGVPNPALKRSQPAKNEKGQSMKQEAARCKAAECSTMTRSSVGYCGKHFYMSNLKGTPRGRPAKKAAEEKAAAARPTPANGRPAEARISLSVDEQQLNRFLIGLPVEEKARLLTAWLARAI